MGKTRRLRLEFPLLGLDRGVGFQRQPPFSSPDMQNVRVRETHDGRARGGSRPGLAKEFSERVGAGDYKIRMSYPFGYITGTPEALDVRMVHSANGELWMDDGAGTMTKITLPTQANGPTSISSDRLVQAVQRGTNLYIADYSSKKEEGTDGVYIRDAVAGYTYAFPGTVTGGAFGGGTTTITCTEEVFDSDDAGKTIMINGVGNFVIATYTDVNNVDVTGDASATSADNYSIATKVIFTSASVANWTTNAVAGNDLIYATFGSTTTVYPVLYVHPTYVGFNYDGGVNLTQSSGTFYLIKSPLRFTGTNLYRWFNSDATMPLGCPVIALWQDRIALGGAEWTPHAWYLSKIGDPTDWDTSGTTAASAISGATTDTGDLGEPLRAFITHSNDYLMFGCSNSLLRLSGNPRLGGRLNLISSMVGIIYRGAWCSAPDGTVYFLSEDGLWQLTPGAMGHPQSLSRERLPAELQNTDLSSYEVLMVYNPQQRGVHIYLTQNTFTIAGQLSHWFYDVQTKAFLPDEYQEDHEPFSACYLPSDDPTESKVILGCRDGYVRSYGDSNTTDDGTEIDSYVVYGPIALGSADGYRKGLVRELVATLAQDNEAKTVDYEIVVAQTAEEAVDACTSPTSAGAVASPTYDAGNDVSTVTVLASIFLRMHVGRTLTFGTSGNVYVISEYVSGTVVKVDGDASGEAGSQTLTLSGVFLSGTWARGQNLSCRPRAGGGAFCLKVSNTTGADYGPWGIEAVLATIESKGQLRRLA